MLHLHCHMYTMYMNVTMNLFTKLYMKHVITSISKIVAYLFADGSRISYLF